MRRSASPIGDEVSRERGPIDDRVLWSSPDGLTVRDAAIAWSGLTRPKQRHWCAAERELDRLVADGRAYVRVETRPGQGSKDKRVYHADYAAIEAGLKGEAC